MHRLEGAPCGTVAVTKKAGQQVCRVSRAGWEREGVGGGDGRGAKCEEKEMYRFPLSLCPLRFIKNRGPISVLKYIATFSPLATIVAKFAKCPSPEALSVCFEPVFGPFTRQSDISEVALIQVLVHLPDSQLPLGKGCTQ